MAVKKTTTKSGGAEKSASRASTTKAAPKRSAATKASAAPKGAAPKKKAAPVKLNERQTELLRRVQGAGESYLPGKGEAKSLESLQNRKLIKRVGKDKESGKQRFSVSKAGEKHLSTPATGKD